MMNFDFDFACAHYSGPFVPFPTISQLCCAVSHTIRKCSRHARVYTRTITIANEQRGENNTVSAIIIIVCALL